MRKNFKLDLTVAPLVAINANEAIVALLVGSGVVCVWSQKVGYVLVRFGRNLSSVVMKMFSHFSLFTHLILSVKIL
jgi:hypothetical protein